MHKKSISVTQNFLISRDLVEKLIHETDITYEDTVLDIGAGKGMITEVLSNIARNVIAIELDNDLVASLRQQFMQTAQVTIEHIDFLQYALPGNPYAIFANIPFMYTAAIMRKLLNASNPPSRAWLIMQQEAAFKYMGKGKENLFSLLYKPWFDFSLSYTFRPSDFSPQPHVPVVLLAIRKREHPFISPMQRVLYNDFVAYAFMQRKATLHDGLKKIFTTIQFRRLAEDIHFHIDAVPTDLSFLQWQNLFVYYEKGVSAEKKRHVLSAYTIWDKQQAGLRKIHRTQRKS